VRERGCPYHASRSSSASSIDTALRTAITASLRLLDVAPDFVTVPLCAAIWRVAVGATDFGEHLTDASGEGKSAYTALLQAHWGSELDAQHLPARWLSTSNANELLSFLAKAAVLAAHQGRLAHLAHFRGERPNNEAAAPEQQGSATPTWRRGRHPCRRLAKPAR
jgi:hypothetical protein